MQNNLFPQWVIAIVYYMVSISAGGWWMYRRKQLRDSVVFVLVLVLGGVLIAAPFLIWMSVEPYVVDSRLRMRGPFGPQLVMTFIAGVIIALFPAMVTVLFRFWSRPEETDFDGIKRRSWLVLTVMVGLIYLLPLLFFVGP